MKNKLPLIALSLLFFSLQSFGQIELLLSDYHKFDNRYFRGFVSNNLQQIAVPSSGENQTWDYFLLQNDYKDTLSVVKVDATPYSDTFPDAEIALTSNFTRFFYESISSEGSQIEGLSNYNPLSNLTTITRYNFEGFAMPYPIQFGDNYTFNYAYSGYYGPQNSIIPGNDDTSKINSFVAIDISVDGHGMLSIPAGMFEVLRFKQHSERTDSSFVLNDSGLWEFNDFSIDSSETYLFFTKNIGSSLLTITERQGQVNSVAYLTGFVINSIDSESDRFVNIFPQPADEFISVKTTADIHSLTLLTLQGKEVKRVYTQGLQNDISVSELPAGIYVLQAESSSGKFYSARKVVVAR
jgi:hypothetical protein